MKYDAIELTKKLVTLPSYVDGKQDEMKCVQWLEKYCRDQFPRMQVERQYIGDTERANLIIRGRKPPKFFVLGHVDTVLPAGDWHTNPLRPQEVGNRLYGLGASDMKGSLAAFLAALAARKDEVNTDDLMVLVYVDEEYSFAGMKQFVQSQVCAELQPDMILSLDGSLEVSTGCRGLIVTDITTRGATGHASDPANGINAITSTASALQETTQRIARFEDAVLGRSTLNVAYLQGGSRVGGIWQRAGNVIPDRTEAIIEIRTAVAELNAAKFRELLAVELQKQKITLEEFTVRQDLVPWPPSKSQATLEDIQMAYKNAGVTFVQADQKLRGFIDLQMIAAKMPDVPAFVIGTGGENKHGANENVPLQSVCDAQKIYEELLKLRLKEKKS